MLKVTFSVTVVDSMYSSNTNTLPASETYKIRSTNNMTMKRGSLFSHPIHLAPLHPRVTPFIVMFHVDRTLHGCYAGGGRVRVSQKRQGQSPAERPRRNVQEGGGCAGGKCPTPATTLLIMYLSSVFWHYFVGLIKGLDVTKKKLTKTLRTFLWK